MAYRRSIIARTKLFYQQQQQRFAASFSHISGSSSDREEELPAKSSCRNPEISSRFPMTKNNAGNSLLSGNVSRLLMRSSIPAGYGLLFHRNLSKVPSDIDVLNDAAAEYMNGVVVGEKAAEAAPVVNEVAVAAADSSIPVAAFQYLIDYVHCYTGLQWWASIAAATLLIRFIHLPFYIDLLKFIPALDAIQQQQQTILRELIPKIMFKHKLSESDLKKVESFNMECLATLPLLHLLSHVNAGILFFAISNMAEKVPSFVAGGTLWFTDLTTPDHSMCLPILLALTLWIRWELDPRGGPGTITTKFNAAVALVGAVAAGLPSAIYCSWITSNLFSIAFAILMMDPRVPKLLGIPMTPPSTDKKNSFKQS